MSQRRRSRRAQARNNRNWLIGIMAVLVLAVVIVVFLNSNTANPSLAASLASPVAPAPLDKCGAIACGSASAPVTLDLYADFQCPYCRQFESAIEQLGPSYVDTGKVKIVYHNFAFIGPESETAAQAALCAGDQNRFWLFEKELFARQGAENSGVFTAANLKRMAASAGLDTAAFNSCLDSGKHAPDVVQDVSRGRQLGVKATPTFFVNGQMHEGGVPYEQLTALLDAALAGK